MIPTIILFEFLAYTCFVLALFASTSMYMMSDIAKCPNMLFRDMLTIIRVLTMMGFVFHTGVGFLLLV